MYHAHWVAQMCLLSIHILVAKKDAFIHCAILRYHYRQHLVCQRWVTVLWRNSVNNQQDLPE